MPGARRVLVFYLAAALAVFGGIYTWALPLLLLGSVIVAILAFRDRAAAPSDTRPLDLAIVALLIAVSLQLVPLPSSLRDLLSPELARVETALRPGGTLETRNAAPLSLAPRATVLSLALLLATSVTYLAARRILSGGGIGFVCAAVSIVGAIAAVGALIQRAVTPRLIFGFWQPVDAGALPFGPVVNRNHFAAWLLMASALAAGYLVDRGMKSSVGRGWGRVKNAVIRGARSSAPGMALLWLVMVITIAASQSRSALVGFSIGGAVFLRATTRTWLPTLLAFGGLAMIALLLLAGGESTITGLADRFAGTLTASEIDRSVIWRETAPMLTDFAVTGVGAGAFSRAMLAYQQTRVYVPHLGTEWYFNHAHNHYLQILAEGGLLVAIPAGLVLVLFAQLTWRRLREGDGGVRGMRLAAAAGLLGVGVQSVWEVPLTMPAAALLAATLAAIATCRRAPARESQRTLEIGAIHLRAPAAARET